MASILIVDDHETNRVFLQTLLGYAGYELLEAADGAAALALVRASRPDLVIADIVMPTMDGYTFARALRADPALAATRVIFLTAAGVDAEVLALARACGVEHVLSKPVAPELMLSTAAAVLERATSIAAPATVLPAHRFDQAHIRLLTDTLAASTDQLATTNQRLAALLELSQRLAAASDPSALLQECCDAARAIVGARYAAVELEEPGGRGMPRWYSSGVGANLIDRLGDPLAGHARLRELMSARQPVRLRDLKTPFPRDDAVPGHPQASSFLGVPLRSAARDYGVLHLADKLGEAEFSSEDEQIASMLAALAAMAYENLARYETLQQHATALEQEIAERQRVEARLQLAAQRLTALHRIDQAILEAQSPEAIAEAALSHLRQIVPCRRACIVAFDFAAGEGVLWALDTDLPNDLPIGVHHPLNETPDLEALRRGEVVSTPDLSAKHDVILAWRALVELGLRSALSVPIGRVNGLIGTLNLYSEIAHSFTADHVAIAREVADMLAVGIQNARLFEQVRAGRKRLQLLSGRLVQAQEDERRRIARELHDEIGQSLTAAQLNLQTLLNLTDLAELPPRLEDSFELIDRVLQQVRALSLDLRPSLLDDLGLGPALRWLGKRQAARAGFAVAIDADQAAERYPTDIETTCFRVAQEALTNITRYAKARQVALMVARERDTLRMTIRDDGVGFDVAAAREQASQGRSLGLMGMQERVALAGGALTIDSAVGAGTTLTVVLPLEQHSEPVIERRRMPR